MKYKYSEQELKSMEAIGVKPLIGSIYCGRILLFLLQEPNQILIGSWQGPG